MSAISQEEKFEKVESLDAMGIETLMMTLLDKKGFINIKQEEGCVIADQSGLLGNTKSIFVTFPFKLGGPVSIDVETIAEQLIKFRDYFSANSIYVYSQKTISKGFQSSLNGKFASVSPQYLGRDEIVKLITEVLPEFWRHEDLTLIKYEKNLVEYLEQDNDLKKLKFPKENYGKLLNIFVEPRLVRYYEDSKTKTTVRKNYSMVELIKYKEPLVIDGQAGYGKSTLLKSIARYLIDNNGPKDNRKNFPIYLSSLDIFENNFNIGNAIRNKIGNFTECSIKELSEVYQIHLLIDSIDEFEDEAENVLQELADINNKYGIKYYIATRNYESIVNKSKETIATFSIRRFNLGQIKLFLTAFFSGDEGKTSSLLDAIRENQMIERLPMSPLTLSLITILFEEKELEIPATISDIYDNFNTLIIGKAVVSSKVEFIDISFKERILSIYAYELMERHGHIPMTKNEFVRHFQSYYAGKSLPIKRGTLEDVLLYLLKNTGILYLKDGNRVQFTHDSYMEYYAALEIFKHKRADENILVDKFLDSHWQSVAIFYGGMSKDMPEFLRKINSKISNGTNIKEYMSAILGVGFLLQALYQTDNKLRKDVILSALKLSLCNLEVFKMMAADDFKLFKNYNLPILSFINFVYFYETFNSITLAEPLRIAFDETYEKYKNINDAGIGYNLLELAFTLDSKRIQDQRAINKLILETPEILKDPVLNMLASISIDLLGKDKYKEYISELRKTRSSLSVVQNELIQLPMKKLRFSAIDNINQPSKVKIFVEGVTDATILQYAYMVLTNGCMPYWNITTAGPKSGKNSCDEVAKTLIQSFAHWTTDKESVFIGIFDHDAAGLSAFRGRLEDRFFEEKEKDFVKKHREANIYGLCLPVPGEMDVYLQKKQEFNFFEIEHYFGYELLHDNNMLENTGIPNIYQIKDTTGAKTSFTKKIKELTNPKYFEHFLILFQKIDELVGVKVNYEY